MKLTRELGGYDLITHNQVLRVMRTGQRDVCGQDRGKRLGKFTTIRGILTRRY